MNNEQISYLLSDVEDILKTEGDRMLLDDIKERLEMWDIDEIESFAEDIFEYSTMGIDENDIDYIELFNNYDILHFDGKVISKELWLDRIVPDVENRLSNIESAFPLTLSHISESRANDIIITISKSNIQEFNDDYTIKLVGCGLVVLYDSRVHRGIEQWYFSPRLVEMVLDHLKSMEYLSLDSKYMDDSLMCECLEELEFSKKYFCVKVAVGDRSKSVCNYYNCNPIMVEFENYIEHLVFDVLKKYNKQPDKCAFCGSTNITDFKYSKPTTEVIAESENDCCKEWCHCVANHKPAWICEDCETIYFRE